MPVIIGLKKEKAESVLASMQNLGEAQKKEGVEVEAFQYNPGDEKWESVKNSLIEQGLIGEREDGNINAFSQEIRQTGEADKTNAQVVKPGMYIMVDRTRLADKRRITAYCNTESYFKAHCEPIEGREDYYLKHGEARTFRLGDKENEMVNLLVETGSIQIHPEDPDHYYSAILWGGLEETAKDSTILIYGAEEVSLEKIGNDDVIIDETGAVLDKNTLAADQRDLVYVSIDDNFISSKSFEETYFDSISAERDSAYHVMDFTELAKAARQAEQIEKTFYGAKDTYEQNRDANKEKPYFINLSNHPFGKGEQMEAAKKYGEVVYYKFPNIDPKSTDEDLKKIVNGIVTDLKEKYGNNLTVMCQGQLAAVSVFNQAFAEENVQTVVATTTRENTIGPDGKTTSTFKFVGFREMNTPGREGKSFEIPEHAKIANFSARPYATWGQDQKDATMQITSEPVLDIKSPNVSPTATKEDVRAIAAEYVDKLVENGITHVVLNSEMSMNQAMAELCEERGIQAMTGMSERAAVEVRNPDGTVTKTAQFKFNGYCMMNNLGNNVRERDIQDINKEH